MHPPDPSLPRVFSREQARAAGLSDRQVSWRASSGEWLKVGRGLYVVATSLRSADDVAAASDRRAGTGRPLLTAEDARLLATLRATRRDVVVGVAHAARLWGLPRPLGGWGDVVLLATSGPNRGRSGYRVTVTPLADDEVTLRSGAPVTSVLRTVSDCLRLLPAPDALAIADAAARRYVPVPRIVETVERCAGRPGVEQARRLAPLVDGRRDSTLESWSALAFATFGVPMPVWQVDVLDDDGFVGRVDGFWECGLVGESDGRAKYRLRAAERGGVTAEQLARILDEERARDKRLRATGLSVVRWDARDVLDPHAASALADRLRRELSLRTDATHTARTRPHPTRLPR